MAALEIGADFLPKPFGVPELMGRIRNSLRTQRLLNDIKSMKATLDEYKGLLSPAVKRSRIFLCHAHEDKPKIRELDARLSEQGFNTWLDEKDILPGDDWDLTITRALKSSDIALICLSYHAIQKRGYVQKEVKLALDILDQMPEGRTFLIPVLLEPCELPIRLSSRQGVKLYEPQGMDILIRAITMQLLNIHQEGT